MFNLTSVLLQRKLYAVTSSAPQQIIVKGYHSSFTSNVLKVMYIHLTFVLYVVSLKLGCWHLFKMNTGAPLGRLQHMLKKRPPS